MREKTNVPQGGSAVRTIEIGPQVRFEMLVASFSARHPQVAKKIGVLCTQLEKEGLLSDAVNHSLVSLFESLFIAEKK